MDTQKFDAITRLAANAPDRRNMLKLVGAAAVAGTAGFLARADEAEAALVNIIVTRVIDDVTIRIPIKNNNVAVQVCAAIEVLSSDLLVDERVTCAVEQR